MTNTITLWLYPGASPNSVPTAWGPYEKDISAFVRRPGSDGGAQISYSWGKQDESTQTDAGQMTLTLDNRDGRFSTDKIDGPYYGLIDVNTPIRLGVTAGTDTFTRTVTAATGPAAGWGTISTTPSQAWANPSAGAGTSTYSTDGSQGLINVSGVGVNAVAIASGMSARDADITTTVIPKFTASGGSYATGHIARYTDSNNFSFSLFSFNSGGTVSLQVWKLYAGNLVLLSSVDPIPSLTYTANSVWTMRTQIDGDTMRCKVWLSSGSQPTAWQAYGDDVDNAGTGIGLYATRLSGNTNTGNILGIDNFTVIGLEWTGFVVSWPLRWDMTGRNSWAPITCGGVLRRLRQGTNPVFSPLRRQLSATADVTGYWPMEEGSDAKYFSAVVPINSATAYFSGVTPASEDTLAGGAQAPTITTAGGSIKANVRSASGGTGFSAMVFVKLSSLPGSKTRFVRVRTTGGPATIYDWSLDGTTVYVDTYDSQGQSIATTSNLFAGVDPTQWLAIQLETDNSGGSTAWNWIFHQVGATSYFAQSATITGTNLSKVTSMELTGPTGTAFAHIWMGTNTLPFVTNTFSLVSSGYVGETAGARFTRACTEAGIANAITGASSLIASTEAMGAQREGSTLAILQSCADADYGVLVERGAGLEFVPRATRWNLTQTVALSVSARELFDVPQPTRDDQKLKNRWTVSRINGSSDYYQDDASVLRNGTWEDSAQLNVKDDTVLKNHAAWRVYIGVQLRQRWPSIALHMANSPRLMDIWRQRFYGWRLGITTGLLQVTGNDPDLIMEGYSALLDPENWVIDMNCTDARVWAAGVTDDTGILGRADMDAGQCTLTSTLTASTTGANMPVTTASPYPKWDTTPGLWSGGVDLNVGGERITVNAVSNGTNPAQTFTITARGVNGYAAAHAIGTAVSLWYPAVVAL